LWLNIIELNTKLFLRFLKTRIDEIIEREIPQTTDTKNASNPSRRRRLRKCKTTRSDQQHNREYAYSSHTIVLLWLVRRSIELVIQA